MIFRSCLVFVAVVGLAGCVDSGGGFSAGVVSKTSSRSSTPAHINNKVKFSSAAYGVAASPRVTNSRNVRKGGGRRQIGKPYKIKGRWYRPKEEPNYNKSGQASWYGPNFHGRLTANGEVYDQYALSAAHPTFPLPSYARVTNVKNGRSVIVRVNDRGPYHPGRIIDLSAKASELLDYQNQGVAKVKVQYIKQAPLHGLDNSYLSASYRGPGGGSSPAVIAATSQAKRTVGNGPVPSADVPQLKQLDRMATGSVSKAKGNKDVASNLTPAADPFLLELSALRANRDTGTTLALRLKRLFAQNQAATN